MSGGLTLGSLSVTTVAWIDDAEGMLTNGPVGGDLIGWDDEPGAEWVPGPAEPWTWTLGLLLKGTTESARLANLRALQALQDGVERTITRTYTAGSAISESCQGVVTLVEPLWDFALASRIAVMLTVQSINPWTV